MSKNAWSDSLNVIPYVMRATHPPFGFWGDDTWPEIDGNISNTGERLIWMIWELKNDQTHVYMYNLLNYLLLAHESYKESKTAVLRDEPYIFGIFAGSIRNKNLVRMVPTVSELGSGVGDEGSGGVIHRSK